MASASASPRAAASARLSRNAASAEFRRRVSGVRRSCATLSSASRMPRIETFVLASIRLKSALSSSSSLPRRRADGHARRHVAGIDHRARGIDEPAHRPQGAAGQARRARQREQHDQTADRQQRVRADVSAPSWLRRSLSADLQPASAGQLFAVHLPDALAIADRQPLPAGTPPRAQNGPRSKRFPRCVHPPAGCSRSVPPSASDSRDERGVRRRQTCASNIGAKAFGAHLPAARRLLLELLADLVAVLRRGRRSTITQRAKRRDQRSSAMNPTAYQALMRTAQRAPEAFNRPGEHNRCRAGCG